MKWHQKSCQWFPIWHQELSMVLNRKITRFKRFFLFRECFSFSQKMDFISCEFLFVFVACMAASFRSFQGHSWKFLLFHIFSYQRHQHILYTISTILHSVQGKWFFMKWHVIRIESVESKCHVSEMAFTSVPQHSFSATLWGNVRISSSRS